MVMALLIEKVFWRGEQDNVQAPAPAFPRFNLADRSSGISVFVSRLQLVIHSKDLTLYRVSFVLPTNLYIYILIFFTAHFPGRPSIESAVSTAEQRGNSNVSVPLTPLAA